MNKREFATRIADVLKENGITKKAPPIKTSFHITDDNGNKSNFVVRKEGKDLTYFPDDIIPFVEAFMLVVEDAMKNGEAISIAGFGSFCVHRRAARKAPHPITGDMQEIRARYVPKFNFGKRLRTAASIYSAKADEVVKEADDILMAMDDDEDCGE